MKNLPPSHHAWRLTRSTRSVRWLLLDGPVLRVLGFLAAPALLLLVGLQLVEDGYPLWKLALAAFGSLGVAFMGLLDVRVVRIERHPDGVRVAGRGLREEARFAANYQGQIGALGRIGGALNWSHGTRSSFEHDISLLLAQPGLPPDKDPLPPGSP